MRWTNSVATNTGAIKSNSFDVPGSHSTLAGKPSFMRFIRTNVGSPGSVFLIMVALSLPLRLLNLQAPFTGEHEFRQTQTALSVWEIREHGFSLLHPRLPLFGPPWECPFEYPVFQIAAAALDAVAPWTNLDVSIRVTNLIFFYLTALMLFALARLLFTGPAAALFTTAVFLFSPYNVFWSRTSMIEYAATFFGLAYLVCFIHWTLSPGRTLFALTLFLGILGCLTKATSFVIPLITAGALAGLHVLRSIWHQRSSKDESQQTELDIAAPHRGVHGAILPKESPHAVLAPVPMLALLVLLFLPLLVGYLYIRYGDAIKEQAPYTAWLSSRHPFIRGWTYGTWAQRLSLRNWELIVQRMQHTIMPSLVFAMAIGVCAVPFRTRQFGMYRWGAFWIGCSLALAPVLGILSFFNLYVVHSYYLIACAPFLALFAGLGLSMAFQLARTPFVRRLFVLLLIGLGLQEWSGRVGDMAGSPASPNLRVACLSEAARFIDKHEPVIVVSSTEWSAFAPYYLKRRALMALLLNKPINLQPLLQQHYFKNQGFHWLLVEGDTHETRELSDRIMNDWKVVSRVPLTITRAPYLLYSLSDQ